MKELLQKIAEDAFVDELEKIAIKTGTACRAVVERHLRALPRAESKAAKEFLKRGIEHYTKGVGNPVSVSKTLKGSGFSYKQVLSNISNTKKAIPKTGPITMKGIRKAGFKHPY